MDRRAYFVIGPEGSGTYMLAEAFRSAGCHEEGWHAGWHDDYKFEEMPDLFVFRRSLPHARRFPDFPAINNQLRVAGFEIQPVLILRDWHCTVQSVVMRDPERVVADVEQNMRTAIYLAGQHFEGRLIYVSYESFCFHPEFRRWLFCERLGLPEPTLRIHYGNDRYYAVGEDYLK